MKIAERIVIVSLLLILIGGGSWLYFAVQYEQKSVRDAVARGEYEQSLAKDVDEEIDPDNWRAVYPNTIPITVGGTKVEASVADTLTTRIKGLSDTPFLPPHVVKLFAFGGPGKHSMWMKDMQYPLDIMWADKDGVIVHIEEEVSPDTYPESFSSSEPAWYVVEASAGFVASNTIAVGDEVVLPQ